MLFGLLTVVCAIIAGYLFWSVRAESSTLQLVLSGVFVVLTIVFGALFLSKRVNKTEEIHITE
jgi:membrane protein implicated in regulation of membrane protease activity